MTLFAVAPSPFLSTWNAAEGETTSSGPSLTLRARRATVGLGSDESGSVDIPDRRLFGLRRRRLEKGDLRVEGEREEVTQGLRVQCYQKLCGNVAKLDRNEGQQPQKKSPKLGYLNISIAVLERRIRLVKKLDQIYCLSFCAKFEHNARIVTIWPH